MYLRIVRLTICVKLSAWASWLVNNNKLFSFFFFFSFVKFLLKDIQNLLLVRISVRATHVLQHASHILQTCIARANMLAFNIFQDLESCVIVINNYNKIQIFSWKTTRTRRTIILSSYSYSVTCSLIKASLLAATPMPDPGIPLCQLPPC